MPKLKIVGYQTGFQKIALTKLLQESLELDEQESKKMTDAIMSGNVIALDIDDAEFVENLAEELEAVGAKVEVESDEEE
jgi:ribosomal protein L7/L12